MSARSRRAEPRPAGAVGETRPPSGLTASLEEAFRGDRAGRVPTLSRLDPRLGDHLFATPPEPRIEGGRASTTAPAITFRSAVAPPSATHARGTSGAPRDPPPATLPDLLPPGSIIDKYRIEQLLGTGGFGAVYRATHLLLQKSVALKLLRSHRSRGRPELAAGLHDEARFAARIGHPNVVQVHDVTHTPEITYVVMEYVEGTTLARTLLGGRRLPQARVAEIGLDVARGLSAALDQGLIHRDIKPQNIMLTRRGTAKILDLGLARSTLEDAPRRRSPPGRAAVVGTSGYMAPEQLDDPDHIDFRADIYSLGVTLYEAATGVPPFPTADARACAELHRSAPVPAPDALVAGIAPSLSRILLWMLEKSAARRPASYAILERALEDTKATL